MVTEFSYEETFVVPNACSPIGWFEIYIYINAVHCAASLVALWQCSKLHNTDLL